MKPAAQEKYSHLRQHINSLWALLNANKNNSSGSSTVQKNPGATALTSETSIKQPSNTRAYIFTISRQNAEWIGLITQCIDESIKHLAWNTRLGVQRRVSPTLNAFILSKPSCEIKDVLLRLDMILSHCNGELSEASSARLHVAAVLWEQC